MVSTVKQFVNQHSYILVGALLAVVAVLIGRRLGSRARWIALIAVVVALIAAGASLRNPSSFGSETAFDRAIGHGKPVALEFFSNF
jgi:hypothetical protein